MGTNTSIITVFNLYAQDGYTIYLYLLLAGKLQMVLYPSKYMSASIQRLLFSYIYTAFHRGESSANVRYEE